ncbi:unnamed protein product [Amoebophrya sp. A25]|nr:unnamed protein product [Amoebophrya sp. A25]|eukprot:GSA25T00026448001.1
MTVRHEDSAQWVANYYDDSMTRTEVEEIVEKTWATNETETATADFFMDSCTLKCNPPRSLPNEAAMEKIFQEYNYLKDSSAMVYTRCKAGDNKHIFRRTDIPNGSKWGFLRGQNRAAALRKIGHEKGKDVLAQVLKKAKIKMIEFRSDILEHKELLNLYCKFGNKEGKALKSQTHEMAQAIPGIVAGLASQDAKKRAKKVAEIFPNVTAEDVTNMITYGNQGLFQEGSLTAKYAVAYLCDDKTDSNPIMSFMKNNASKWTREYADEEKELLTAFHIVARFRHGIAFDDDDAIIFQQHLLKHLRGLDREDLEAVGAEVLLQAVTLKRVADLEAKTKLKEKEAKDLEEQTKMKGDLDQKFGEVPLFWTDDNSDATKLGTAAIKFAEAMIPEGYERAPGSLAVLPKQRALVQQLSTANGTPSVGCQVVFRSECISSALKAKRPGILEESQGMIQSSGVNPPPDSREKLGRMEKSALIYLARMEKEIKSQRERRAEILKTLKENKKAVAAAKATQSKKGKGSKGKVLAIEDGQKANTAELKADATGDDGADEDSKLTEAVRKDQLKENPGRFNELDKNGEINEFLVAPLPGKKADTMYTAQTGVVQNLDEEENTTAKQSGYRESPHIPGLVEVWDPSEEDWISETDILSSTDYDSPDLAELLWPGRKRPPYVSLAKRPGEQEARIVPRDVLKVDPLYHLHNAQIFQEFPLSAASSGVVLDFCCVQVGKPGDPHNLSKRCVRYKASPNANYKAVTNVCIFPVEVTFSIYDYPALIRTCLEYNDEYRPTHGKSFPGRLPSDNIYISACSHSFESGDLDWEVDPSGSDEYDVPHMTDGSGIGSPTRSKAASQDGGAGEIHEGTKGSDHDGALFETDMNGGNDGAVDLDDDNLCGAKTNEDVPKAEDVSKAEDAGSETKTTSVNTNDDVKTTSEDKDGEDDAGAAGSGTTGSGGAKRKMQAMKTATARTTASKSKTASTSNSSKTKNAEAVAADNGEKVKKPRGRPTKSKANDAEAATETKALNQEKPGETATKRSAVPTGDTPPRETKKMKGVNADEDVLGMNAMEDQDGLVLGIGPTTSSSTNKNTSTKSKTDVAVRTSDQVKEDRDRRMRQRLNESTASSCEYPSHRFSCRQTFKIVVPLPLVVKRKKASAKNGGDAVADELEAAGLF